MDHEGHHFLFNCTKKGVRYYMCSKRKSHYCKGSVKVLPNNTVVVTTPHTVDHPQLTDDEKKKIFRKSIVNRAITEHASFEEIYNEERLRNPEGAYLYSWNTAQSTMQAARRIHGPPIPQTLDGLSAVLESEEWGRRFFCSITTMPALGANAEPQRITEPFFKIILRTHNCVSVVFVCQTLLNLASNSTELHLDGTFKVVPRVPHAAQLFTIHAVIRNKSFPILYALMSSRTMEGYAAILDYVKLISPHLHPQHVMSDFERGLQNAIIQCWSNAQVTGCWFHYCQSIWKKALKLGYARNMREQRHYKKAVQMIMALPLLPGQDIAPAFLEIRQWCEVNDVVVENLLVYVQRFWLGVVGVQLLTTFDIPRRTNNHVESYHYHLLRRMGRIHPNIWVFIEKLVAENEITYSKLQLHLAGRPISRPQSRRHVLLTTRIKQHQRNFVEGQITRFQFLEICGHEPDAFIDEQQNWLIANPDDEQQGEESDEENFAADVVEGNVEPEPEEQQAEEHQLGNERRCVICLTPGPTHLVAPCGHKVYCGTCAITPEVQSSQRCPICNGENVMIVMVRD